MSDKWQLGRGREILEQTADFFYFDDSLSERIQAWCESRCETFIGPAQQQEQSLQNTAYFQEFCELFTSMVESFLTESGIRVSDFYEAMRNELDSSRNRNTTFGNIVLSAVDYLSFCEMMNDVREGRGFCFVPPLVPIDDEPSESMDMGMELEPDTYGHHHHAEGKYGDSGDVGFKGDDKSAGGDDKMDYGGGGESKFHK